MEKEKPKNNNSNNNIAKNAAFENHNFTFSK